MAVDPLIELRDVDKYYGKSHVLQDVSLTVIGPSGSGKSTLRRAVNRLETVESGTILSRGLARPRTDVGMVFQTFDLFAHKTVVVVTREEFFTAPRSDRAKDFLSRPAARETAQVPGGEGLPSSTRESTDAVRRLGARRGDPCGGQLRGKGQREAAYSLGMRKTQVMAYVLVPQGVRGSTTICRSSP
jgi:ABC-type Fe3+/spermidine/putrescine transport system ATPase subunit